MRSTSTFFGLIVTAAGIGAVSLATTTLSPRAAGAAGDKLVSVDNTTANPVPTVAQGVTQVAGTITVGNMPNITISGGSIVGIDPANNTVKIAPAGEKPGRFSCLNTDQNGITNCDLAVPAGQQFIIDSYWVYVGSYTNGAFLYGVLGTPSGPAAQFSIPLTLQNVQDFGPPNGTLYNLGFAAPMTHIIVDAGMTLQFLVSSMQNGKTAGARVTGFGHFLPAP